MNFKELKEINENKLQNYINLNQSENVDDIEKNIKIHELIKELFDKDEGIFFHISMEESLKILDRLVSRENLKEVYMDMISGESFIDLKRRFKL